ncbi:DUF928 domain-containing protein [Pseudanabaena mucicola]|uniref:DUF928 domain-containing protein n=1 Tax=Pseudanabaena mucicola FACHB-723 TaxID=2692860 RepID=A0ABR7ZYL0_9CYAN|nr:DUF928 domain-containing protein [Pseudanabaena mucicola]MBD2188664.1 DUF928 domain-containing protein [Pseudanabaena mucicola FACHB-723]
MSSSKIQIRSTSSICPTNNRQQTRAYLGGLFVVFSCSFLSLEMFSFLMPSIAIAETWIIAQASGNSYGLGLPKTASTGGGTRLIEPPEQNWERQPTAPVIPKVVPSIPRSRTAPRSRPPLLYRKIVPNLPLITLLTPEDGARTASPQPTLYWYLSPQALTALANDNPAASDCHSKLVGQFSLTKVDKGVVTIFETELNLVSGLSSFKLPIAASLQPNKNYRWQISFPSAKGEQVNVSGWVVYTPPQQSLQIALTRALTSRDRAKIYAQAGYWFEAIDGYTKWLNFKPSDSGARTARNEILKAGFANHDNLDVDSLLTNLNIDFGADLDTNEKEIDPQNVPAEQL